MCMHCQCTPIPKVWIKFLIITVNNVFYIPLAIPFLSYSFFYCSNVLLTRFCYIQLGGQLNGGDPLAVLPPQPNYQPNVPSNQNQPHMVSDDPRANLMYPFEEKDHLTSINSMKQFHDQPLPFRLPFSGFQFHYIWVSLQF